LESRKKNFEEISKNLRQNGFVFLGGEMKKENFAVFRQNANQIRSR
jgi:hypothetical protein